MSFCDKFKLLKYSIKMSTRLGKLMDPMHELSAQGKVPERLAYLWDLVGVDEGREAYECPEDQPAIADNAMWVMFELGNELERNAQLFDEAGREAIAEYIGLAEMLERLVREKGDPDALREWEQKHGRPYTGPTERERYLSRVEAEGRA